MGAIKRPQEDIVVDPKDLGRADTLRFNVMTYVAEENYERAIQLLKSFLEEESEYPDFKGKVERYISHGIDLVNAIRAKRRFPGINSLTMAKQQDLRDRFKEHFNELNYVLKKIEKIQADVRITDVRSTVWVVKALINALFAIVLVAFLTEISTGLFQTAMTVADDYFLTATEWIFRKLGL